MKSDQIGSWQQRFRKQPKVFLVYAGGEWTGNAYDTREAAMVEADYRNKKKADGSRAVVCEEFVQDLALSQGRWG